VAETSREGTIEIPMDALAVDESLARVLALMVAANGRIDERELQTLERLDAFRRLRVTRHRFVELTLGCLDVIGGGFSKQVWLCATQVAYIDAMLDEVREPSSRLLVCRLAAAVLVADGRITNDERILYLRTLARWHISQMMVCRAIMSDPGR
jgi:hypothetical protein